MSDGSKQHHLYESLSALVDNEASELELHRILSESEKDPSVRARWHRYQLARTALKGEAATASVDISDAVREAVAKIDLSDEKQTSSQTVAENQDVKSQTDAEKFSPNPATVNSASSSGAAIDTASDSTWKANVARLAIAASVACVVVLSAQQFNVFNQGLNPSLIANDNSVRTAPDAMIASSDLGTSSNALNGNQLRVEQPIDDVPQNSPFSVVDLQNVAGTFNALSSPQQSRLPQQSMRFSPTQQQKQLQDERVRLYIQQLMLEHAENSARHSGSGLMPYTRVPVTE